MNTFFYIVIGIFEAFAVLLIILKLYMLPVREFAGKIFFFVVFMASFSYMMRITLELPKLDLPFQYIFFILFLRFGMELKSHISSFIAGAGISAYAAIQMGIFHVFEVMDIMHSGIVQQNEGSLVYLLQLSSILVTYLICLIFSMFDFGFSFIIRPPHDFIIKENYLSKTNLSYLIGTMFSTITICMTLVLLYRSEPTGLLILALATFAVSYFFSVRREQGDIRKAVEAYRSKHKRI
ncbi:hypothetical protein [Paenibacillus sp. BIC5C1]|uniref:hypothetical protein n=1 Tax=Paenibacillus sp. BIC5C1 TaxID=3078263 RepID=UPI0028ED737D|nr:hypothetical protein [Paenibacillus sp. BIC5C1]